jgi:hypothetical protein
MAHWVKVGGGWVNLDHVTRAFDYTDPKKARIALRQAGADDDYYEGEDAILLARHLNDQAFYEQETLGTHEGWREMEKDHAEFATERPD